MILHNLTIENFLGYRSAFIDFTLIKSALIIGRDINNHLESNEWGKVRFWSY